METIIVTDNKRLSTDYNAQKTLFAQKIDVYQILNYQVYQSHISKIRFWIVKQNIPNHQNFINDICKNLLNRGANQISLDFSLSKINSLQTQTRKEKNTNIINNNNSNNSSNNNININNISNNNNKNKHSRYRNINNQKYQQYNNNKNENQIYSEDNNDNEGSDINKEEIQKVNVNVNNIFKNTVQINNLSDLSVFFENQRQIKSQHSNNYDQDDILCNNNKDKFIISYVFSNTDIQVGVSVFEQGNKFELQQIIEYQISEGFHQQFINFQNKDKGNKRTHQKTSKLSNQISKQTFHKILLFLFTNNNQSQQLCQKQKGYRLSNFQSQKQTKYLSAINDWKINQQQINMTQKLSKQYILIKHQIQNQKLNFKNKLKIFQAIIGQSINVDKLLKQQKQMQNQFDNRSQKKQEIVVKNQNNQISRNSRRSDIKLTKQSSTNNRTPVPNALSGISNNNNSQFRRLKQSSEMIRNIQNTTNEQYKKIQNLKDFLKNVIKQKNQLLYKHAKNLNSIKKEIHKIKQQIQKDNLQLKYKTQHKTIQINQQFIASKPSKDVQKILYKKIDLFKKIFQNQNKPIKKFEPNQNYQIKNQDFLKKNKNQYNNNAFGQDGFYEQQSKNKNHTKQNNIIQNNGHINEIKKNFMIRKQYSTLHQQKDHQISCINSKNSSKLKDIINKSTFVNQSNEIKSSWVHKQTMINRVEQKMQLQLLKKRKQQVQNNIIQFNINRQIYKQNLDNIKQKRYELEQNLLIQLYSYYSNNHQLMKETKKQLQQYHIIQNTKFSNKTYNNNYNNFNKSTASSQYQNLSGFQKTKNNIGKLSSTISSSIKKQKYSIQHNNHNHNHNKVNIQQIELFNFPELFKLLQSEPTAFGISSQCSIISETK